MKRTPNQPDMKLVKVNKWKSTFLRNLDWPLVFVVCLLLVIGLLMLYSVSAYNAQIKFGNPAYYVNKQLRNTAIGLGGMFFVSFIPQKYIKKATFFIYGISVVGEDHIVVAFFVVAAVNEVKEQPCALFVKGTVPDLVNDEAGRSYQSVEAGICLSGTSGGSKTVTQFRRLYEIRLHTVLAAGVSERLRQMRLSRPGRTDESQIAVSIDGCQ